MTRRERPLLSIVIPAYNRPAPLLFGLHRFIAQTVGRYEHELEIVVVDDASPGNTLHEAEAVSRRYSFVRFVRNSENLGLERNILAAAQHATGDYLWVFGDDDFIDRPRGLDNVMLYLRSGRCDVYVLNRTRRSVDLASTLSSNWMDLDPGRTFVFSGLREFCRAHGLISVLGFISVCIFRRQPFCAVDASEYLGTMYPQLGAMVEAFHDAPTLLIGDPIVCHRTPTAEEKRTEHGTKAGEAAFMADRRVRDATYFSYPYVRMLRRLIDQGALAPDDIAVIRENTVIQGLLVDFLIATLGLHRQLALTVTERDLATAWTFFDALPLTAVQRHAVKAQLCEASALPYSAIKAETEVPDAASLSTISVVTPSFNQAEFLGECLDSVRDQSVAPIEHLVVDPGSRDGSRELAESYAHVTLIGEPDRGQSDALNKVFQLAAGDVIAWLNSDDQYADTKVFERVLARFNEPDAPDIVYGRGSFIDEEGRPLRDAYVNEDPTTLRRRFQHEDGILQPALFFRRTVIERVGLLRTDRHFTMDYEYWIRCVEHGLKFAFVDDVLAIARYHRSNKTFGQRAESYAEICDVMLEHFGYVHHTWLRRYAEFNVEGHDGVLTSAARSGVTAPELLEREHRRLLLAYDGGYDTRDLLTRLKDLPGYGETLGQLLRRGSDALTPCQPVAPDRKDLSGHVCYTVGPRRWAFERRWKHRQVEASHQFLRARIAVRESDVCVIAGNGPSLNRTDLSLLEGHDVIISNNAFLSDELRTFATYYTVVNYLVAEQSAPHINLLANVHKIVPYWLAYCVNEGDDMHFVDAVGHAQFSTDLFSNMSWRHTVTFFNLHLAYGLGYRRVVLIGLDHSYQQGSDVVEQDIICDNKDDLNHFSPSYFRGKQWQAADVTMMESMYKLALDAFVADDRDIVNATVGGALELFPRADLSKALQY